MNQDTLMKQEYFINCYLDDPSLISYVKLTNLDRFFSNRRIITCNRMRLQYKELGFSIEIDLDINFIPFLNNTIIIQIDFGTNYNSMELELNVEIKVNNHENHSYLDINSLIFLPPTKISFKKDFKLNVLDEYLILK